MISEKIPKLDHIKAKNRQKSNKREILLAINEWIFSVILVFWNLEFDGRRKFIEILFKNQIKCNWMQRSQFELKK